MWKALSQIIWNEQSIQNEHNSWKEWQNQQYSLHYEKSEIFSYYRSQRPMFRPPRDSCINNESAYWYSYCFGDFTCLIVEPINSIDIMTYIKVILDVYDVCKGFRRSITGDPNCINVLRKVISTGNLQPLSEHNFTQYNYDYTQLHAHTVAQYSLSTLLMRLVSHYLTFVNSHLKITVFPITISHCQQCLNTRIFGEPQSKLPKASKPIPTPSRIKNTIQEEIKPTSWPYNKTGSDACFRCKVCQRATEKIHGDFHVCLDCHIYRICSKCGLPAVVIDGNDKLPKCQEHSLS